MNTNNNNISKENENVVATIMEEEPLVTIMEENCVYELMEEELIDCGMADDWFYDLFGNKK